MAPLQTKQGGKTQLVTKRLNAKGYTDKHNQSQKTPVKRGIKGNKGGKLTGESLVV